MLLGDPVVWPDEAVYADIARNIIVENRLGTDLLKGMIPGFESHAYWSPPLFMYGIAAWFKVFGFSILNQRLFSVTLGTIAVVIFFLLTQRVNVFKKTAYLIPTVTTLLLVTDPVFLKASRISRPEIMVLAFTSAAFLIYLKILKGSKGRKNIYLFLCGLLLGLGLVTHMLALSFALAFFVALITNENKNRFNLKKYFLFIAGLALPTIIRLLSIFPNYSYLFYQLNLITNSSNYTKSLYFYVSQLPLSLQSDYFLVLLIFISFLVYVFKNRTPERITLALILILSWAFSYLGSIQWYAVYPIFFTYLGFSILMSEFFKEENKQIYFKAALAVICLGLLFAHLNWFLTISSIYKKDDYQNFSRGLQAVIPPGKTVYLSSLPDAYYPLAERNKIYTYPTFTLDLNEFKKILDDTGYIVFNNFYSPPEVNAFTNKYLDLNVESVSQLNGPYQIYIIKLKEKHLRQEVK